jgi:metal-responsive CopG/Arc/MetJ family transcriptional regulator
MKVQTTVRIERELLDQIDARATQIGKTRSEWITAACEVQLAKRDVAVRTTTTREEITL